MLFGMLGMAPGVILAILLSARLDSHPGLGFIVNLAGAIAVLLCIALAIAGMVGAWAFWFRLHEWLEPRLGVIALDAVVEVRCAAEGLHVGPLGCIPWQEVLACEGIPDSDDQLLVHTARFDSLMMYAPIERLAPVIGYFRSQTLLRDLVPGNDEPLLHFTAQPFSRIRFWAWCGLAWGLAIGCGILVIAEGNQGILNLLGALVLGPMMYWLIMYIPLTAISILAPRRTRAYTLAGTELIANDGSWRAEPGTAHLKARYQKGTLYELNLLTLRTTTGRYRSLRLDEHEWSRVIPALVQHNWASAAPVHPDAAQFTNLD
ncbi:hypothetical protein [Chitinolyticbacter albus]|uniref:hypothetical protein n=1 Tax=Chitinolyticbacter albus TaxID=2961951 RepID=UPI00210D0663|nr:hypothetical protein [Chitinolyticbacter albus]